MLRRILLPLGTLAILVPLYVFVIDPYPMPEQLMGVSRDLWLLVGFAAVFLWVAAFSFGASPAAPAARAATIPSQAKSKPVALPPSPPAKILSEAAWSADTDQAGQPNPPPAAIPTPAPPSLVVATPDAAPAVSSDVASPSSSFDAPGMTMMMPSIISSPAGAPLPAAPTPPIAAPSVSPFAAPVVTPPSHDRSPVASFAAAVPSSESLRPPEPALPSFPDEAGRTMIGLKLSETPVAPTAPAPRPVAEPPRRAAAPSTTVNDYDALYREFVRLRTENGEPPAPPREKFIESLASRRDSIRKESGVDDVRFEVYSKAGRATLRATPIRRPR